MKRNGAARGHLAPLPPAVPEHQVQVIPAGDEALCSGCCARYRPAAEGQAPTPWRIPLCESCFLRSGRQAA